MSDVILLIDQLANEGHLSLAEYETLINERSPDFREMVRRRAEKIRKQSYEEDVYIRGLIEFTNYCQNDCYYCGIRRSNQKAERYRLSPEEILMCCENGYQLGFRTFVLQGGEDPYYKGERLTEVISEIKSRFPDCALTLSAGEHSYETYQMWRKAGADRYLLRHETSDEQHYRLLHPASLSPARRKQCLMDLKELGYQIGTGFMVGSPGQTSRHLAQDFVFIEGLAPQMVGIGPFIPHQDTPFAHENGGTASDTIYLLSLLRILLPDALLPSTTALGTIDPLGREKGIQAGANVVMPNLSPRDVRGKYLLYDGKICTGDEAAECVKCMGIRMNSIGYQVKVARGDHPLYR